MSLTKNTKHINRSKTWAHSHTWGYTPRTLALEWAGWWPPSPHAAMPHTACQVEVMELFRNQDERENIKHNTSSHLLDKILSNILNLIAKLSWYIHHEDSLTPSHTEFFRQRGCDLNIWNVFLVAVKERQPPKQENRWQQDNPKERSHGWLRPQGVPAQSWGQSPNPQGSMLICSFPRS